MSWQTLHHKLCKDGHVSKNSWMTWFNSQVKLWMLVREASKWEDSGLDDHSIHCLPPRCLTVSAPSQAVVLVWLWLWLRQSWGSGSKPDLTDNNKKVAWADTAVWKPADELAGSQETLHVQCEFAAMNYGLNEWIIICCVLGYYCYLMNGAVIIFSTRPCFLCWSAV